MPSFAYIQVQSKRKTRQSQTRDFIPRYRL